jgi:hypothetical protein
MTDDLSLLRSSIRKDLVSVGLIPTGLGIQLVAQEDPALGFALLCEAIYVQLYHDREAEQILAYLAGPLLVQDAAMRNYMLKTALHVRKALVAAGGDHQAAYRALMRDSGAEKEVLQKVIEACVRTAKESGIPWDRTYLADFSPRQAPRGWIGCVILLVILAALLYGLYRLVRLFTG